MPALVMQKRQISADSERKCENEARDKGIHLEFKRNLPNTPTINQILNEIRQNPWKCATYADTTEFTLKQGEFREVHHTHTCFGIYPKCTITKASMHQGIYPG